MSLTIHPLCVGKDAGRVGTDGPATVDADSAFTGAMYMFLITGGSELILVDTGTRDSSAAAANQAKRLHRPPELEPLRVLRDMGVAPADVDIVVNTHLHWDHCSNNDAFRRARVIIQREELLYACAPIQAHRRFYDKLPDVTPNWVSSWSQIELVEGDCDVVPGVNVVFLPGHTPGSQGVLVESGGERALVAGDAVNHYRDWEGDDQLRHFAPALNTSLVDCYASLTKIERLGCTVIPSHDLSLAERGAFTVG